MKTTKPATAVVLAGVAAVAGLAFTGGHFLAPGGTTAPRGEQAAMPEVWTCSMHPQVRRDGPGQCPICGMALVRAGASSGGSHAAHAEIDAGVLQQLGLREAEATRETWRDVVRAPARLAFDERAQALVQTRVGGYVTRLVPRAPGDTVRRGEVVAEVYSPEAATAWAEYQALQRNGASDLASAARTRLARLGFAADALREGTEPRFAVRAPFDGVVEELMVDLGSAVTMGMPLMRVRDPKRLWAIAEVPETTWPRLERASTFELVLDAWPEQRLALARDSTAPMLEMARRTIELRLALVAPEPAMRPGMLGEVRAEGTAREVLAIPSEAVLRSAGREWVLSRIGEGRYVPRAVRIGARRDGRAEVLEGLGAGARVVASGQFLLDSEAYLARAFADLDAADPGTGEGDHGDHRSHADHSDHGDHSEHADHSDHTPEPRP